MRPANTAADSTGSGRSGGLHSGMLVGMGVWAKTADWTPTRLRMKILGGRE